MSKYFSEVFTRDNRRCVYCGRDMMVDFETFWITVEDHLVPSASGGTSNVANIVTSCAVCNNLKGPFVPDLPYRDDCREQYIYEIREYIMRQRAKKMTEFATWTHPRGVQPSESPKA